MGSNLNLMSKSINRSGKLYLFNLSMDQDNKILSHSILWARKFASNFEETLVVTTHAGFQKKINDNMRILELGGGRFLTRFTAIGKLLFVLVKIILDKKRAIVFYHMTTRPAVIIAPIARMFGIKQGLWYSHQKAPKSLKFATLFVNSIFSPTEKSFPIKTAKLIQVGHGIETSFWSQLPVKSNTSTCIAVVGRVSRVKRIESLIQACSRIQNNQIKVEIIGPVDDGSYLLELEELCHKVQVDFDHIGELRKEELLNNSYNYRMVYSGTLKSVDKAPLEMMATGMPIVSSNIELMQASGMDGFWREHFQEELSAQPLETQIRRFLDCELELSQISELRTLIEKDNNLDRLIQRLVKSI
jgi:glycosyltransferase involved in cell wall biosynthesis